MVFAKFKVKVALRRRDKRYKRLKRRTERYQRYKADSAYAAYYDSTKVLIPTLLVKKKYKFKKRR